MFSRTAASLYRSCFPRGNAQRSRTAPKACWMASIGSIESLGIHRSRNDSALSLTFKELKSLQTKGHQMRRGFSKASQYLGLYFCWWKWMEVVHVSQCVTYPGLVGNMVLLGSCVPKSQPPRQHRQGMSAPGCQANLVKVEATHPEGLGTCELFSTDGMRTEGWCWKFNHG